MENNMHLRLRLKNCLQTILDLRDDIDSMPFGSAFTGEIGALESFLEKLADISLNEYEVRRVEFATSKFLDELELLLMQSAPHKAAGKSRLQ